VSPETTTELGRRAEARATEYLESWGLELLERNFRCRGGEIDLVMSDGDVLVLVEVRSRSSAKFGGAAASVDPRKQRRLVLAARTLLAMRPRYSRMRARFDVIAFEAGGDAASERQVIWIKDAFRV
jgi:putative endonuclease